MYVLDNQGRHRRQEHNRQRAIAMGNSLKRLTGDNSLLSESDIGRLALHNYLLANDPLYIRAMRGNGSNA